MPFGDKVKRILDLKGITQSQLAEKLGVTRQSISIALKQERPHQKTIENFAAALNVDPKSLKDSENSGITIELLNNDTGVGVEMKSLGDDRFIIINPLVTEKVMKGYISRHTDPGFLSQLPRHAITIDRLLLGDYRSFEVWENYNSKFFNTILKPGCIVTCRKWDFNKINSLNLLGNTLAVIVTMDRVIITEFFDYDESTDSIFGFETRSDSSDHISIRKQEIQEFYEVLNISVRPFQ